MGQSLTKDYLFSNVPTGLKTTLNKSDLRHLNYRWFYNCSMQVILIEKVYLFGLFVTVLGISGLVEDITSQYGSK